MPADANIEGATHEVHIFTDATEQAYGAIAFMRTESNEGQIHLFFILGSFKSSYKTSAFHSTPGDLCGSRDSTAGLCPGEGTYFDSGYVVVRLHYHANLANLDTLPVLWSLWGSE